MRTYPKTRRRRFAAVAANHRAYQRANEDIVPALTLAQQWRQPDTLRRSAVRSHARRRMLAVNFSRGLNRPITTLPLIGALFIPLPRGPSGVFIYKPDWSIPAGISGPLIPISWKTSRYVNQTGTFEATFPVDEQPIGTSPVHMQICRGWHVSIVQENTHPLNDPSKENMLTYGVVLDRGYEMDESGAARFWIKGAFRSSHLFDRSTLYGLDFNSATVATIANTLVNGASYIGPGGGIDFPTSALTKKLDITFYDETRMRALLQAAALGRYVFRESWTYDRPELVSYDGPPDSGITFRRVEQADPALDDAGDRGLAVISTTPRVRYDGTQIVNQIIPKGSDTHTDPENDDPLTLEFATNEMLDYPIWQGTNPDGSSYYYIRDHDSEETYGIVQTPLIRTDVKNPSDDPNTRERAANVLYRVAVALMHKHKAEYMIVDLDVSNGPNIWCIPGDQVWLDFVGWAQLENSTRLVWIDEFRRFLVAERHDEVKDPSGVREVRFRLAAPVIEIRIPELPDAIVLPPPPEEPLPGLPPELPPEPGCCDDPNVDTGDGEDNEPPTQVEEDGAVVVGRLGDFNFTAGLPPPNAYFSGEQSWHADNLGVQPTVGGDMLIRFDIHFRNHAILGVNGAIYNVHIKVGTERIATLGPIGPLLQGEENSGFNTVEALARDVSAGTLITWEFEAIVVSTLTLGGGGTLDASSILVRKMLNVPPQPGE